MAVVLTSTIQRWAGLSTDTKPTATKAGSLYYETDSGLYYVWGGAAWTAMPKAGPNVARKTVTFTGAANLGAVGDVPLFTVTGTILVRNIIARATTTLGGATATLALGVTGATAGFIAATTATLLTAGTIWQTATPTAALLAAPAATKEIIITANVLGTVAVAGITSGVLAFTVIWEPLEAGSTLV